MNGPPAKYLPFDAETRVPAELPPPGSCDCQVHLSGDGRYKVRAGAAYEQEGATCAALLRMHGALGIARGIVVQASVHGTDNTLLADSLQELGPAYRGVGAIDDSVSDTELQRLHALGVRGIRFNFGRRLNYIPSPETFARAAARAKEIGWIVKINLGEDGLQPLESTIRGLRGQTVAIDHAAKVRGLSDPNLALMIDLLRQGDVWLMLANEHVFARAEAEAVARAYLSACPDRLVWGTDWPHSLHTEFMPNDADLLERLYRCTEGDAGLRRKVLVENPAALYFRDATLPNPSGSV